MNDFIQRISLATGDPESVDVIAAAFCDFHFEKAQEIGARCLKLSAERFDRAKLAEILRGTLKVIEKEDSK